MTDDGAAAGTAGLAEAKGSARALARTRRAAAAERLAPAPAGIALKDQLLQDAWFIRLSLGLVVGSFLPISTEVDPRPLTAAFAQRGHVVALPVVEAPDRPLRFRQWAAGRDVGLEPGPFGTRHPPLTAPEVVPDLLIVPLLAFDMRRQRLGYGGGYYDRTIAALTTRLGRRPITLGVAYAAQAMERVPTGPDDATLDLIVTEEFVLRGRELK